MSQADECEIRFTLNPTVILARPKSPCISFTCRGLLMHQDIPIDVKTIRRKSINLSNQYYIAMYLNAYQFQTIPALAPYKRSDHLIFDSLCQITVSRVKWFQVEVKFPPDYQIKRRRLKFTCENKIVPAMIEFKERLFFTWLSALPSQARPQNIAF